MEGRSRFSGEQLCLVYDLLVNVCLVGGKLEGIEKAEWCVERFVGGRNRFVGRQCRVAHELFVHVCRSRGERLNR